MTLQQTKVNNILAYSDLFTLQYLDILTQRQDSENLCLLLYLCKYCLKTVSFFTSILKEWPDFTFVCSRRLFLKTLEFKI